MGSLYPLGSTAASLVSTRKVSGFPQVDPTKSVRNTMERMVRRDLIVERKVWIEWGVEIQVIEEGLDGVLEWKINFNNQE